MTGRTGYTGVDNAAAMQGPKQITEVYEHFDPLIGESLPTLSSLPALGGWTGRTIYIASERLCYIWDGNGWIPVLSSYRAASSVGGLPASYTSVVTLNVPAGTWRIEANGNFDFSTSTPRTYTAEIWNSTAGSSVLTMPCGPAGPAGTFSISGADIVTVTVPTQFSLRARTSGVDGSQLFIGRLLATQTVLR